jgi:glycosyltransferase involved in cell wall biosynthesis
MSVAVIMTTYQQGEYVGQAVRSVLEQTYEDWALTILDDGSTDGTSDVIEGLGLWRDSRVTYERLDPTVEERRATVRYASNLNRGVAQATGDLLTFLCGDDFYMPDRLERMVAKITEAGSVVYGPQLMLEGDGRERGVRSTSGVLGDAYHRVDLNSVMLIRQCFDAVGGFPDRPATPELWREADAQLWRKLTAAGYWFHPVDGPEATDCKRYLDSGVDARVIAGKEPW